MAEEKTKTVAKKPQEAAQSARQGMSLREKMVELRKACPKIIKEKHSDSVSYKYAKIYDVWEVVTPVMNELGVDFDVTSETATKHEENGDPIFYTTMITKTRAGERLMFLYEADLGILWTNVDNESDRIETTVHAIGWNDDPAKAKGAAHTYALKYYLFEKFSIDQGEDDPDNADNSAQGAQNAQNGRTRPRNGQGVQTPAQPPQNAPQSAQGARSGLSQAQVERMYRKGEDAGVGRDGVNDFIRKRFGLENPAEMTRQQYEEVCGRLDRQKANKEQQQKGEQTHE